MTFAPTTPGSRRRPWPYDAYLGDVKVLLQPDQDGNLVSESSKTLDATAPVDYTYSSANPYKERTSEYQKLYGGFGQSMQPEGTPRRYSWAEKADLSIDGLWMKGPAFEQHVEDIHPGSNAGEVRQFIQALHGVVLTTFAICEAGVYRRAADNSWIPSLTTGTAGLALAAGTYPQQAVRFKNRGTVVTDSLYVACSTGNLYQYNGATWALAAAGAGPPDYGTGVGQARYIERVADELWVAGDYGVAKCEDNPMDRTKWSGVIYVGDQSAKVTWLRQVNDTLYIFKEDGIYTIDSDGLDHELFPTLRGKNSFYNGKNASVWLDRIWFTYGNQTFTLNAAGQLRADGLEQMLENTSDVKGRWVGGAGHNTWFMYEVYYNEINDTSYLVKHGTWVEENSNQDTPGVAQFAEAHHGSLFDWDKRATTTQVLSGMDGTGNDRIYVGFLDGTLQWAYLPKHSPNPNEDNIAEFTTLESYVYLPLHHSNFRADNKLWHGITVAGPYLTASEWVEIEYRTDTTNPLATWTLVSPDQPKFTIPAQRLNIVDDEVNNPVYGRALDVRVHLRKSSDLGESPLYVSPVIEGVAIHESIRPAFSREFTFSILADSFLPRRDGTVDRRRGWTVQQNVLRECATIGPVTMLMPTGESEIMTIVDYRDQAHSRKTSRDHAWLINVRAIQLRTITEGAAQSQAPITSGWTYERLEQYTLGELEALI